MVPVSFNERFLPMDADGRLDREHGIVQVVAGTGGCELVQGRGLGHLPQSAVMGERDRVTVRGG
jgi:hypothetical protein